MDGTGLFYKKQGSFCASIMHCANHDPRGYRGTKDLSITEKGSMECLAQTSDTDKIGSQSPYREGHISNVCAHIHTRVCLHTWMHLPGLPHLSHAFKMQELGAQLDNWVTGQDTGEV